MRKFLLVTILNLTVLITYGQIDEFYYDYSHDNNLLNPSLGATESYTSLTASYYRYWTTSVSPVRYSLTYNTKFKKTGLSVSLLGRNNGPYNTVGLSFSYFYNAYLTATKHLVFSASIMGMNDYINTNNLMGVDLTINPYLHRYYPQLGAGILYYTPKIHVGLSVANILQTTGVITGTDSKIAPPVFITDFSYKYRHPIELFYFQPRFLAFISPKETDLEPSFYFYLDKVLKIGAAYRYSLITDYYNMQTISALFGLKIKNRLLVNYRLDYTTNTFLPPPTRLHNSISIRININKEIAQIPRFF